MTEPNDPIFPEDVAESSVHVAGKRRKVSTACSACQSRKTKCSGTTPCEACASRNTPCIYDVSSDQRRKLASRRNLQKLSEARGSIDRYQQALGGIIAILRAGSRESAEGLLATIRSGVPLSQIAANVRNTLRAEKHLQGVFQEIAFHIDDDSNLPSPTQLFQTGYFINQSAEPDEPRQRARKHNRSAGNIASLINPPITVPAHPWTTVTNNDELVSHLMSLWFTWIHPWWRWIDQDLFLEAMSQQDLTSPFCTAYLVNMILADACALDEDDTRDDLRRQFLSEAVTHLEQQHAPASLTLIQAMGIQGTHLNTNSEDKIGLSVLSQQNSKVGELRQWRAQLENQYRLDTLQNVDQCLDQLTWTLFLTNGLFLMSYKQSVPPANPAKPMPVVECQAQQASVELDGDPWIPYPNLKGTLPFHDSCHFASLLSLTDIVCKEEAALRTSVNSSLFQVSDFHKALEALQVWPAQLSECMKLVEGSTPHVIALHAVYHWALINIYKQAIAAEEGHFDRPLLTYVPQSSKQSFWRESCRQSAIAINDLMIMYHRYWGSEYFPAIASQFISVALFSLLEELESEDGRSAFVSLCFTMHMVSKTQASGRGVLQLLYRTAKDCGIQIPGEAVRFFEGDTVVQEMLQQRDPNASIDLEYMLGKWKDLDLNKHDQQ